MTPMPHLVIKSQPDDELEPVRPEDVDAGASEHYIDAELYDYEYRRRRSDVRFYRDQARQLLGESGDILEIACGSGRITTGLLRDGHHVVGLDWSGPMLARAAARIAKLSRIKRMRAGLIRADMRQFTLRHKFPLIVMGFNSFEHLYTRPEVEVFLANVREHLAPGGRFIFDVQNPDLRWLCRDPRKRWARTKFTHPRNKRRYIYTTNHDYDPVSQIVVIRLYYQPLADTGVPRGREMVVKLSQRKFFPAELEALLVANGFRTEERYGDFEGDPLHPDAENQVLVCSAD